MAENQPTILGTMEEMATSGMAWITKALHSMPSLPKVKAETRSMIAAGGLGLAGVVGAGAVFGATEGCAPASTASQQAPEHIGTSKQALTPLNPLRPITAITLPKTFPLDIEVDGAETFLYFTSYDGVNTVDVYVAGSKDQFLTLSTPVRKVVGASDNAVDESLFRICEGGNYAYVNKNEVLYKGLYDKANKSVGTLNLISAGWNFGGSQIKSISCDANTLMLVTKSPTNYRLYWTSIATPTTLTEMATCNDGTNDASGVDSDGTDLWKSIKPYPAGGNNQVMGVFAKYDPTTRTCTTNVFEDVGPKTGIVINPPATSQTYFVINKVTHEVIVDRNAGSQMLIATAATPDAGTPPVEAGPPDSGENDAGIPLASCKTINVTENPQNVRLFDCDDTKGTFHGKILGPAKYTVGSANDEVKRVQPKQASDFSQTDGRHMHFGDGVLHRMIENEPDPNKKKTVNQWGDVTGLEGTDEEWNQPDDPALNPPEDIANGVTRIISEQNRDGHVRNHTGATCPAGSDVAKCPTDESFAPGGELANGIIYTEYVNGKRGRSSVNKADLAIKPPIDIPPVVKPPPEEPKKPGCGCTSASQGIHQTRLALSDVGDLAGDFGVVAVGGFLTVGLLRKKEEPKPKKDKEKEENMAA